EGRLDLPLARRSDDPRSWWMKADPAGDPSLTLWRVMGRSSDRATTWLELEPITGRTHQLRVHCAASGFPIVGDPIYGSAPRHGGPGLQLHARRLALPLYPRKPPVVAEAPLPEHMRAGLSACGWTADTRPAPAE
ncbi:pseudouridine synthase, partial [Methylobacterium trifolii]